MIPQHHSPATCRVKDVHGVYRAVPAESIVDAARRYAADVLRARPPAIRGSGEAPRYLRPLIGSEPVEHFCALWLDVRHRPIRFDTLGIGTIDSATVCPRETVRRALAAGAAAVILAHNHPSGNPEPSPSDISVTHRLRDALELFGVRVLDHFVITGDDHFSMAERGLL